MRISLKNQLFSVSYITRRMQTQIGNNAKFKSLAVVTCRISVICVRTNWRMAFGIPAFAQSRRKTLPTAVDLATAYRRHRHCLRLAALCHVPQVRALVNVTIAVLFCIIRGHNIV